MIWDHKNYISAIKFFYTHVLNKEWNPRKIPRMKRIQKFPVIPAKEDVIALLNATKNLKHKAIIVLIYGSGLRVSETLKSHSSERSRLHSSRQSKILPERAVHNIK